VAPRHLAMHLSRILTGKSYQAIGTYFGGRDPATVRHACRAAAARLAADPALAAAATALLRRWRSVEPPEEIPAP
jgi:chromosomal replication initiator protein